MPRLAVIGYVITLNHTCIYLKAGSHCDMRNQTIFYIFVVKGWVAEEGSTLSQKFTNFTQSRTHKNLCFCRARGWDRQIWGVCWWPWGGHFFRPSRHGRCLRPNGARRPEILWLRRPFFGALLCSPVPFIRNHKHGKMSVPVRHGWLSCQIVWNCT